MYATHRYETKKKKSNQRKKCKTEIRIKFTMIDEMEKLKKKKKMSKICASTKINIVLPYVGLFQKHILDSNYFIIIPK